MSRREHAAPGNPATYRAAVEQVRRKLGLSLPSPLKRLFSRSPKLRYLWLDSPHQLVTLSRVAASTPPRMLRLFSDRAGNDYGLYYPRDGGRPFAVYHDHEEYMLVPLTSNLNGFFGDPDSWAVDNPSNERKGWESPTSGWRRLFVDPETSRPPELEVLKPMHLHYRHLEKSAEAGWKRGIFARLFRRWGAYNPKLAPMR